MKEINSILIIYNPNALKGNIENSIPQIKQRLSLRYAEVECIPTSPTDSGEEIAFKLAPKFDVVVSCGGDGTFHYVLNGVMKSNAKCLVGVLPYGTCNDIGRTLKVPKQLNKSLDCLLRLQTTQYCVMFDGCDYISYSLATGYLTDMSYKASNKMKKMFGRFGYFLSAFKSLFKLNCLPLTVTCDGERIHGKFLYMMVVNDEYAGGFKLNKNHNLSGGKFKVVLIKNKRFAGFWAFVKMFLFGIKGVLKNKSVIVKDVENLLIENHSNAPFTIDGEKVKFLKKNVTINGTVTLIKK